MPETLVRVDEVKQKSRHGSDPALQLLSDLLYYTVWHLPDAPDIRNADTGRYKQMASLCPCEMPAARSVAKWSPFQVLTVLAAVLSPNY